MGHNRLISGSKRVSTIIGELLVTRNVGPPTRGFVLAPAEGGSLQLNQKGQRVILLGERTDRQTDGWTENGIKGS